MIHPGLPGAIVPPGKDAIPRRLRDLQRQIEQQDTARRAEQSAIGQGGLRSEDFNGTGPDNPGTAGWMIGRVPGGESYLIMNGMLVIAGDTSIAGLLSIVGQLSISGPTTITGTLDVTGPTTLDGATSINDILDVFGQVDIHDGAGFRALYPDGATGAKFGPLTTEPGGAPDGTGLLVQGPTAEGQHDIFKAKYDAAGTKRVAFGETSFPIRSVYGLAEYVYLEGTHAGTGTDAGMWLHSAGDLRLTSATLTLTIPWSTTSSAANVYIDADGRLWKSTSARKYKRDIEDAEIDIDAVLRMQPRSWRDRAEVEREPESDRRYVGFIAEELDDLGLGKFVTRDEDGEPDGIAYDRLVAAVIPVLRSLSERLDRLETPPAP